MEEPKKILENLKEKIYADIIESLKMYGIESILVHGSWGKDEISYAYIPDIPHVLFLSDIELIVYPKGKINIFKRLVLKKKFKKIEKILSNKYNITVEIGQTLPSGCPIHPIQEITLHYFDMKWGSKVIYGSDLTARLFPVSPSAISLWEGFKLVFNRMAEFLVVYNPCCQPFQEMISNNLRNLYLRRANDKLLLALQSLILISSQKYVSPLCRVQYCIFKKIYTKEFKQLYKKHPIFLKLVKEAIDRIIKGYSLPRDKIAYLEIEKTAEITNEVLHEVAKKSMDLEFETYTEFQEFILDGVSKEEVVMSNLYLLFKSLISLNMTNLAIILLNITLDIQKLILTTIPIVYFDVILSNRGEIKKYVCSKYYKKFYQKLFKIGVIKDKFVQDSFESTVLELWKTILK